MTRDNITRLDAVRAAWLDEPMLHRLLEALAGAGGEGRVAGGAVRNALLGRGISDIDVATTLTPDVVSEVAAKAGFSVHPTGFEHGTVTVVGHDGGETRVFEVTTLRADIETDGRHAVVRFTDDWALDAERRDLTINALYCDGEGVVHDFVGGLPDIVAGRVRFVGDAGQRIEEDYLRILRFFRFHAWYGRGRLGRSGLAACAERKAGLARLSKERIGSEMRKLLAAPHPMVSILAMASYEILAELLDSEPDTGLLGEVVGVEAALGEDADPVRRLRALYPQVTGETLKDAFRLSNGEAQRLDEMAEAFPPSPALRESERKALLYRMTPGLWRDAVVLAWARNEATAGDRQWRALFEFPAQWTAPRFPLAGRDLIAAGFKPGPMLGETLVQLEDWWIASDFAPDREALIARARSLGLG